MIYDILEESVTVKVKTGMVFTSNHLVEIKPLSLTSFLRTVDCFSFLHKETGHIITDHSDDVIRLLVEATGLTIRQCGNMKLVSVAQVINLIKDQNDYLITKEEVKENVTNNDGMVSEFRATGVIKKAAAIDYKVTLSQLVVPLMTLMTLKEIGDSSIKKLQGIFKYMKDDKDLGRAGSFIDTSIATHGDGNAQKTHLQKLNGGNHG